LLNMNAVALEKVFQQFYQSLELELASTQPLDEMGEPSSPADNVVATPSFKIEEHLHALVEFVATLFLATETANEREVKIQALVKKHGLDNAIQMENLIVYNNKANAISMMGVCRHAALLTGYLLAKLIETEDPHSSAKVFRFRADLIVNPPAGLECKLYAQATAAHAVIVLATADGRRYLLDSTRRTDRSIGLVMELNKLTESNRKTLNDNYEKFNVGEFVKSILYTYPATLLSVDQLASIKPSL
jgi:hypothetical protein